MKIYSELPPGALECPVCAGTGRVPAEDSPYKSVVAGYDAPTDTFKCDNCGGQYMFGAPKGYVKNGCAHRYKGYPAGNCLTTYTCELCGDRYQIDSGG